jgi:N-acetylmuramoyl-L-alanine amidase
MQLLFLPKRNFIILILPVFLFIGVAISHNTEDRPLSSLVIVVDAGHGGIDSGANRPGVVEKEINLPVSLKLKDVLNHYGAKVVLSRDRDIDLSGECDDETIKSRYRRDLAARIEMVEESDADLFISIHANAGGNSKHRGAESFYYSQSEQGKKLANSIQTELIKITKADSEAHAANYFVLRKNRIPATLIELGYITNMEDRALLQSPDYQQKLAVAIGVGIVNYCKNSHLP